jgi:hypothetical protein
VDSEGELAYRLWRRGLELTLAEVAGFGATMPLVTTEEQLAALVAQRLMLSLLLLRRTGKLALLGIEAPPAHSSAASVTTTATDSSDALDGSASAAITSLGGSDFL